MRQGTEVRDQLWLWFDGLHGMDDDTGTSDRLHSLHTAALAEGAGADDEVVVAALFHDAGKAMRSRDHGVLVAELLRPYVRRRVSWLVRVHEDFTARELRNGRLTIARYRHALHPGYRLAKQFVDEWDLQARDPSADVPPVEHFVPIVDRVLVVPPRGPRGVQKLVRRARRKLSRYKRARL